MPDQPKRNKAVMIRLNEEQAAMLQELAKVSGVKGATHAHRALINLLECFAENPEAFRQVKWPSPPSMRPERRENFYLMSRQARQEPNNRTNEAASTRRNHPISHGAVSKCPHVRTLRRGLGRPLPFIR